MTEHSRQQKQTPCCDVVVVNYNSGGFLARCVNSVLCSELPVSLIVVDNASSDNSLDLVRDMNPGHHRLEIVENSDNLGFSKAVNIGAGRGESPFVFLLNPDCEIFPHTIGNLIEESERCENFGILGALVFNEDGTEQRGCRRLEPTFTRSMVTALRLGKYFQSVNLQYEPLPDSPQQIDAVSGSSMLIDRPLFDAIGGMDEGYFLHVEDLDICRRVREYGKKVYFTPNVSLFHYQGASSNGVPVKTEWHKHQGMLRYQSKFQKPNQSAIRSILTRTVVYMNFLLSIVRQALTRRGTDDTEVKSLISSDKPVVITGARSDLGEVVLSQLAEQVPVFAVSRGSRFPTSRSRERWISWSYFEKVPAADFPGVRALLSLSPIWAAPNIVQTLGRVGDIDRLIAFSSTSIEGKATTSDPKEQRVVQQLVDGEEQLASWCGAKKTDLTICRASMVYGGPNNKNIALVKRFIRWFRFFPMISEGTGRRQPVHVADLANAATKLLEKQNLPEQTYVLAGAEQLSYRHMIESVFSALGQKTRFWMLSRGVFSKLISALSVIPGLRFLSPEMIARMEHDLIYDIEPARRDFEYAPGMFRVKK